MGYALENRAVMSRTFLDLLEGAGVARLTPWFAALQAALARLGARDAARVVVLTPGPANETYFEHAYLAGRLGYPLAQGDDLTVHDGRLWLKTVAGLKPVDVLLRRVDGDWCDPLELRQESRLGCPGLAEVVRRGNLAVVNALGAGVLENAGLLPFLPALARSLLGEDLVLPAVPTWWCGEKHSQNHVLAHLPQLVVKPIFRSLGSAAVFGPDLDRRQLATWRERLKTRPHLYVGQEVVPLSTAPALEGGRLIPRRVILRPFLVAGAASWQALPGALAFSSDRRVLSGQSGALSKDTWVVGAPLVPTPTLVIMPLAPEPLTSRSADNLYWTGRYLERAEAVARLLGAVLDGVGEEEGTPAAGHVLAALSRLTGTPMPAVPYPDASAWVRIAVAEGGRSGALVPTVGALLRCTYSVREHWSFAITRLLERIERDWVSPRRQVPERADQWVGGLVDALAGVVGLAAETLPRGPAFGFFELGRRIERGLTLCALLGQVLEENTVGEEEREALALTLQSADSLVGFRRRYRAEPFLAGVLELLVWEPESPRSLLYQIQTARRHLAVVAGGSRRSAPERLLFTAEDRLLQTEALTGTLNGTGRTTLVAVLAEIALRLRETSDALAAAWFTHVQESHPVRPSPPAVIET
jgi:uncharacterized alpha-E superfamily protein